MDLTTLIGAIAGMFLITVGIMLKGAAGFSIGQFLLFWNFPSILITFGGTFAATLINYPVKQVVGVFTIAKKILTEPDEDSSRLIGTFVSMAQKAKKEGFLSLQSDVKRLDNDFLKRGIGLVIDGQDHEFIRSLLETEVNFIQERHKIGQEIFVTMGTYSPSFGMIGTIIGLIQMLANLQDQAQIASGMALALLTTFYGATAAYLFFLPIAGKLKRRSESELLIKEIIIRGVLLIQSGTTPSVIEANLQAYLEPNMRKLRAAAERAGII